MMKTENLIGKKSLRKQLTAILMMTNYDQFKAAELLVNHPELWKAACENIIAKANAITLEIAGDRLTKTKTQHYSWTSQSEFLNTLKKDMMF